jgi:hypothetical protein
MPKLDLHVVSIPDHRAQLAIAQMIAGANHAISMQNAMDMAKNPPILLFHNLDPKDAQQHINRLKELGIGFKFSKVDPAVEIPQEQAGKSAVRESEPELDEFAGIKTHNAGIDKNAPPDPKNARKFSLVSPIKPSYNINRASAGAVASADTADIAAAVDASISANKGGAPEQRHSVNPTEPPASRNTYSAEPHKRESGAAGGSALSQLREKEKRARRNSTIATVIILGFIIVTTLMLLTLSPQSGNRFTSAAQTTRTGGGGTPTASGPGSGGGTSTRDGGRGAAAPQTAQPSTETQPSSLPTQMPSADSRERLRDRVGGQQQQQANAYVDSARASGNSLESTIAFYRIAISFNRYNLAAWQGLLQAYRELGRTEDVRETEEQMRAIFGDRVTSVADLVKTFGTLQDAYMNDDGTYRVEYRTMRRGRNDITREVFNMTRAVRAACGCDNVTIYAVTGAGRGLIVHTGPGTSVHSLPTFTSQADIIWLE